MEYRADLQNVINEFEISDPISREFMATYHTVDSHFTIKIKIQREAENRYGMETTFVRNAI